MSAADPFMEIRNIDMQLRLWVRHLRKPGRGETIPKIRGIIDALLDTRLLVSELDQWWELERPGPLNGG